MKTHNVEQCSEEWFELRKGKMSASHATAIGNCGKGLDTYIRTLMSEQYSSAERENYTNKDIDRGNELEPIARTVYELENDVEVEEVGFIEYDKYTGCSPDGLVRADGLVEIKCLNDLNHFNMILDKKVSSGHMWQMQMQMLCTGRKWVDYVVYNPNYKESLIVIRVTLDKIKQKKLIEGIKIGTKMIKEINKQYN